MMDLNFIIYICIGLLGIANLISVCRLANKIRRMQDAEKGGR